MGRTIPAVTQLIFNEIEEIKPLYEGLRRNDQLILDDIFKAVIQHKAALANTGTLLPLETILVLVLLEERKRINAIENKIDNLISQLLEKKENQLPESE